VLISPDPCRGRRLCAACIGPALYLHWTSGRMAAMLPATIDLTLGVDMSAASQIKAALANSSSNSDGCSMKVSGTDNGATYIVASGHPGHLCNLKAALGKIPGLSHFPSIKAARDYVANIHNTGILQVLTANDFISEMKKEYGQELVR